MTSKARAPRAERFCAANAVLLLCVMLMPKAEALDFTYTNTNGIITITGYTGPGGNVTIPSTIEGLPVTRIGGLAFNNQSSVTSIVIPDSVTSFESGLAPAGGAFGFCTGLTNVAIPNSVTNIGDYAFVFCTHLVGMYFQGNSPNLGAQVFWSDNNLAVFYAPGTTGWGPMFGGRPTAVWNDALDFTYTNTNGTITITGYTGPGGDVVIPSIIDGLPVSSIGDSAFYNSFILTGVAIPNVVTNIGSYAFFNATGLSNVSMPEGLTVIGNDTFAGCTHLSRVAIPNSVTSLGQEAFFNCRALASLSIGSGITSIHGGSESGFWGTFAYCTSLTKLTIPDNVTTISDGGVSKAGATGAFFNCSGLTNVVIGKGLYYLGLGAFSYCSNLVGIYFRGNAPLHSQDIFGEDTFHFTPATAYYLPGTTGWQATYSTLPTALWNPHALVNDGGFGVRQSGFGFNITGTPDIPIVIEATTNLAAQSWVPLQSGTLTNGLIYFSDSQWTNYPERLYRIRSP